MERMGLMYLIGALKKRGKAVDILVTGAMTRDKLIAAVKEAAPDLIAVSAMHTAAWIYQNTVPWEWA